MTAVRYRRVPLPARVRAREAEQTHTPNVLSRALRAVPGGTRADEHMLEQVRRRVAEPGMSAAELDAVVADALAQLAPRPRPTACRCLPAGTVLDERRCWRCGREVTRR